MHFLKRQKYHILDETNSSRRHSSCFVSSSLLHTESSASFILINIAWKFPSGADFSLRSKDLVSVWREATVYFHLYLRKRSHCRCVKFTGKLTLPSDLKLPPSQHCDQAFKSLGLCLLSHMLVSTQFRILQTMKNLDCVCVYIHTFHFTFSFHRFHFTDYAFF